MPAAQFIGDLAALAPCMETGGAKYYLQGIAMQARDMAGRDSLVMVATDGHQMGLASRPIPAGAGELADCIIPARAVEGLIAARKAYPAGDTLSVESDGKRLRVDLGDVVLTSKLVDGAFPDWTRVWGDDGPLAPIEAQEALFPDLLPGAPVAMLEKLAKPHKGALTWSPAREGQLGEVAGDPGLLFGVLNLKDDGACGKKGFSFKSEHGEGEITGPDGLTYPVAFSDKAISLSAAQLRALVGESCFETMAVTIGGRLLYILAWLWNDGASRFLTVAPNGRTWAQGEYVTRAEIEAALAGEGDDAEAMPEISGNERAGDSIEDCAALDGGEMVDAVSEAPRAKFDPTGSKWRRARMSGSGAKIRYREAKASFEAAQWDAGPPPPIAEPAPDSCEAPEAEWVTEPCRYDESDPEPGIIAALVARIEALEVRLATLPGESIASEATETVTPGEAIPETRGEYAKAMRTSAHERAVRRAWAERKARRFTRLCAQDHRNALEAAIVEREALRAERDKLLAAYNASGDDRRVLRKERDDWEASCRANFIHAGNMNGKRRRSTLLARDLQQRLNREHALVDQLMAERREARRERDFERARADTLHAQLARIAADTADYRERARAPLSRLMGGTSPVALRAVA
jgi:hypothetical protein